MFDAEQAKFRLAAAVKDEEAEKRAARLAQAQDLAAGRIEIARRIDATFADLSAPDYSYMRLALYDRLLARRPRWRRSESVGPERHGPHTFR